MLDLKYDIKDICGEIDDLTRSLDSKRLEENQKLAIEKLIEWTEVKERGVEFKTFYPLRTHFNMDLFTVEERQTVHSIKRSGKLGIVTKIVNSELSRDELEKVADNIEDVKLVMDNPEDFKKYLRWKRNKVDDKKHANENTGDFGEQIIYDDLKRRFPQEGRVKWVRNNEYDFEVMKADFSEVQFYVDAKTTIRGFANQDSIPMYMRTAQWTFLEEEKSKGKYYLVRVWGDNEVRYLKIELDSLT